MVMTISIFLISKKAEIEKFEQKHKKYMSNSYKIAVLPGDGIGRSNQKV